jgi:hypothetical protein
MKESYSMPLHLPIAPDKVFRRKVRHAIQYTQKYDPSNGNKQSAAQPLTFQASRQIKTISSEYKSLEIVTSFGLSDRIPSIIALRICAMKVFST